MSRKPKQVKRPCKIKPYVAENIDRLINHYYPDLKDTQQAIKIGKIIGVGKNTILRARNPSDPSAPGIDTIEFLAEHFGLSPHELLIPNLDISISRRAKKKIQP